jgi:hypothetical protein
MWPTLGISRACYDAPESGRHCDELGRGNANAWAARRPCGVWSLLREGQPKYLRDARSLLRCDGPRHQRWSRVSRQEVLSHAVAANEPITAEEAHLQPHYGSAMPGRLPACVMTCNGFAGCGNDGRLADRLEQSLMPGRDLDAVRSAEVIKGQVVPETGCAQGCRQCDDKGRRVQRPHDTEVSCEAPSLAPASSGGTLALGWPPLVRHPRLHPCRAAPSAASGCSTTSWIAILLRYGRADVRPVGIPDAGISEKSKCIGHVPVAADDVAFLFFH